MRDAYFFKCQSTVQTEPCGLCWVMTISVYYCLWVFRFPSECLNGNSLPWSPRPIHFTASTVSTGTERGGDNYGIIQTEAPKSHCSTAETAAEPPVFTAKLATFTSVPTLLHSIFNVFCWFWSHCYTYRTAFRGSFGVPCYCLLEIRVQRNQTDSSI